MQTENYSSRSASRHVNAERLWARHMEMAEIGKTKKGGVSREALTVEDAAARARLVAWAMARSYGISMDAIGNLFVRREGTDHTAAPVLTGSHLDSQPRGGRFDGVYGVLAGLEALEALDDACITTRHPIEVVNWTNEEGSRFMPGCTGSQVFRDPTLLEQMLALKDAKGIALSDALEEVSRSLPKLTHRPFGSPVAAYIEAHIEQGPQLERASLPIGIVTGIQGTRHFEIEVFGQAAHAGTTPPSQRHDALLTAAQITLALEQLFLGAGDEVRFTVGRFDLIPNAKSVVPGHAFFTVDFRHPQETALRDLGDEVSAICEANRRNCRVVTRDVRRSKPIEFIGVVPDTLRSVTRRLGYGQMDIFSGAGHDARYMLDLCPTGMIFVPCEGGASHCEEENASPEDLAAGARVLVESLLELAGAADKT